MIKKYPNEQPILSWERIEDNHHVLLDTLSFVNQVLEADGSTRYFGLVPLEEGLQVSFFKEGVNHASQ